VVELSGASIGSWPSGAKAGAADEARTFLLNIGISTAWPDPSIPVEIGRGAAAADLRPMREGLEL
jgi:hypothetical protein